MTWMDLEGIILNEMSDRERQVLQMLYGLTFFVGGGWVGGVQLGMRNFLPPGIKPVPPALEAWGLSCLTTREFLWFHLHVES